MASARTQQRLPRRAAGFFFSPHKKRYLVYQLKDKSRGIPYGPCYSTTENIANPTSWTKPAPFYKRKPYDRPAGIDFWIIRDDERAQLFFTSLDGRMWRAATKLSDFPSRFKEPKVVLRGDVFEASHTYRLRGLDKYLTLIEAEGKSGGRGHRYYKAYIARPVNVFAQSVSSTKESRCGDVLSVAGIVAGRLGAFRSAGVLAKFFQGDATGQFLENCRQLNRRHRGRFSAARCHETSRDRSPQDTRFAKVGPWRASSPIQSRL